MSGTSGDDDGQAPPPPDSAFAPPGETDASSLELEHRPVAPRAMPRAAVDRPYADPALEAPRLAPPSRRAAALGGLAALLVAPLAALLPERWLERLGWDQLPTLRLGGTVAGCAQMVGGVWIFGWMVVHAHSTLTAPHGEAIAAFVAQSEENAPAVVGSGMATYAYVLFSLPGLFVLSMAVEGVARLIALGVSGESFASWPLVIVDKLLGAGRALQLRLSLGPLVVDEVARDPGGTRLAIRSCRPRPWTPMTLLELDGALWRVTGEQQLPAGPRRFVYTLEQTPPSVIARGSIAYRPDELLERRKHAVRHFFAQVREELRKMLRGPRAR